MVKFIHNSGSYAHRGVWHVVESVTEKVVPYRLAEYTNWKTHLPEHVVATVTVLCHSVTILTGGTEFPRWSSRRNVPDGEINEQTANVVPPQFWPEEANMAPRPLCSRCAKKAGV